MNHCLRCNMMDVTWLPMVESHGMEEKFREKRMLAEGRTDWDADELDIKNGRIDGRTDRGRNNERNGDNESPAGISDERKEGRIERRMEGRMYKETVVSYVWADKRTDGWTDCGTDGQTNGLTDGWTDERTKGRSGGRTDERINGRTDCR